LALQDPQQVSKPKYRYAATALLQAHPGRSRSYPNFTNGQYPVWSYTGTTAFFSGEATVTLDGDLTQKLLMGFETRHRGDGFFCLPNTRIPITKSIRQHRLNGTAPASGRAAVEKRH